VVYSQTYNFCQNTQVDSYITKAFQRCGIMGPDIVGLHVDAAILDLNLMFSEWGNRGINLFTVEKTMFQISEGQPSYILAPYTVETTEVTASHNKRLLGGTPFSSAGGVAGNAFDGSVGTSCIQTAPNGYISYTYPTGFTPAVYYMGVQSNTNTVYSLVFEYTYDGNLWINGLIVVPQLYPATVIMWMVIPVPINAIAVRVRETGGATLNVQEIFFSRPEFSRILTAISREEWTSYPRKQEIAVPSSYYLDRQDDPFMTLWPTPNNLYETIVFNSTFQIMDVTQMNQNANIPQRFMESAISGLAARMALIFAPDKFQLLDQLADRAFQFASREDVEDVPMRIQPNLYYT
jgi:hypothetical protein